MHRPKCKCGVLAAFENRWWCRAEIERLRAGVVAIRELRAQIEELQAIVAYVEKQANYGANHGGLSAEECCVVSNAIIKRAEAAGGEDNETT